MNIGLEFNPDKREYTLTSAGNTLVLKEDEFRALKGSLNGIIFALGKENKAQV